jgi:hypothetical protein
MMRWALTATPSKICDFAMRTKRFVPCREGVIGAAEGRVSSE